MLNFYKLKEKDVQAISPDRNPHLVALALEHGRVVVLIVHVDVQELGHRVVRLAVRHLDAHRVVGPGLVVQAPGKGEAARGALQAEGGVRVAVCGEVVHQDGVEVAVVGGGHGDLGAHGLVLADVHGSDVRQVGPLVVLVHDGDVQLADPRPWGGPAVPGLDGQSGRAFV